MRVRNTTRMTERELQARLRFYVGMTLAVTLALSVCVVLFALIFVSQPAEQAPNDAEFFRILGPTIAFLTGTLSGVMIGSGNPKDKDGDGIPDDEQEVPK